MKKQIINLLDSLKIKYNIFEHLAVFTVAESSKLDRDINPIKSLLLQDKGGSKFLVVTNGDTMLDLKLIRDKISSKRLSFVSEDTLIQTFGVTPGAVSIFGLLYKGSDGVKVIIDEEVMKNKELGFHPNINTSTIVFSPIDLPIILHGMSSDFVITKLQ